MSKSKISLGFDEEELAEVVADEVLPEAYGQRVEYSRNLLYKYILTPHTQDIKRYRVDHGGLASVPLFPEEEEALKQAASYKGMSLNDFIREAALNHAKSILITAHKKAVEANPDLKDEPNKFTKIMSNPLNKVKEKLQYKETLLLNPKHTRPKLDEHFPNLREQLLAEIENGNFAISKDPEIENAPQN